MKSTNYLTTPAKVTAFSLLGVALTLYYLMAFVFHDYMVHLVAMTLLATGLGAVVITGWRWAPALGPVYNVAMIILEGGPQHAMEALSRPQDPTFAPVVLSMALATIATGSGVIALAQNYGRLKSTPAWFHSALSATAALCVGALLVASVPAKASTAPPTTTSPAAAA